MIHDEKAEGPEGGHRSARVVRAGRSNGLGHQARKRIGTHLRAMYDGVLQQPVPDRFTDLIARLEDDPHPAKSD